MYGKCCSRLDAACASSAHFGTVVCNPHVTADEKRYGLDTGGRYGEYHTRTSTGVCRRMRPVVYIYINIRPKVYPHARGYRGCPPAHCTMRSICWWCFFFFLEAERKHRPSSGLHSRHVRPHPHFFSLVNGNRSMAYPTRDR